MSLLKNCFWLFYRMPAAIERRVVRFLLNILFRIDDKISIGKNYIINGYVKLDIKGKVIIGQNFIFDSGSFNPFCSNVKGSISVSKDALLEVGDNVGMSSSSIICEKEIRIGNNVNVGACTLITDTDEHPIDYRMRRRDASMHYTSEQLKSGTRVSPIVIEDDVWIGANVIILKGVTIGARSVIGAGSVVAKSIPADCVAVGNPCVVVKRLTDENNSH